MNTSTAATRTHVEPARTAVAADHVGRPSMPMAFVPLRDQMVRLLFREGRLSYGTLARLRWDMFIEHGQVRQEVRVRSEACEGHGRTIPDDLRTALEALHREERAVGFGGPGDFVIRFRGGSGDLVSRANSVRRVIDRQSARSSAA